MERKNQENEYIKLTKYEELETHKTNLTNVISFMNLYQDQKEILLCLPEYNDFKEKEEKLKKEERKLEVDLRMRRVKHAQNSTEKFTLENLQEKYEKQIFIVRHFIKILIDGNKKMIEELNSRIEILEVETQDLVSKLESTKFKIKENEKELMSKLSFDICIEEFITVIEFLISNNISLEMLERDIETSEGLIQSLEVLIDLTSSDCRKGQSSLEEEIKKENKKIR